MSLTLKTLRHTRFWFATGLITLDLIFFSLTDPRKVASALLMVAFGLLALSVYLLVKWSLALASVYGLKLGRYHRRLALCVTAVIGGLLALQSIGELTVRDSLVLTPLAIVVYLYLSYGKSRLET